MSENYEKVKYYYDHKMWNKKRVRSAVGRWITVGEYRMITGEDYQRKRDWETGPFLLREIRHARNEKIQSRKESIQDMSFRIIIPTDYAGTYWKI